MTSVIKRWFLSLVVLITAAAIISYLVVVVGLRSPSGRSHYGEWLLISALLVVSIGITHIIWNRLDRSFRAVSKELLELGSDMAPRKGDRKGQSDQQAIDPDLKKSLVATRKKLQSLQGEAKQLELRTNLANTRRQHLEAVLRSIPEAVIVTGSDDRVVLANRQAEELFGFSQSSSRQKKLQECIADQGLLRVLEQVRLSAKSKVVAHPLDSGRGRRWYDVILSAGANSHNGPPQTVLAILHDVTRQREAASLKTDFISNVSHEMRTPLASIKAYLEMLIDGEITDEQTQHKFYEVIQKETDRLSSLVENVLNISRIEAGAVKVIKQAVPLTTVIKEVVQMLGPEAEAGGVELICELTPAFFQVQIDREMVRQAVFNLISNGLKYTPRGGSVTVRLVVDEVAGQVRTEVADTGVGIGQEHLPRIFEKFYRVPSSRKMAKGSGLGLALVKEIVETAHEGQLEVSSVIGQGSIFSFSLPLAEEVAEVV